MEDTKISWTDHTFNPWIGCAKVSPGCVHCYAERLANRMTNWGAKWGVNGTRVRTSEANWEKPVTWNREALGKRIRDRVFCSSLADVFEDREDLVAPRADLFELIRKTPHLDWLLLTKRPENIAKMLPTDWGNGWPNVWLGTSTEDQTRYDLRVPTLLAIPARVHFISAEPLIGPIKLAHGKKDGLDWVIVGGESGPGFRRMETDWACAVRDDCKRLDTTFFFKQYSGLDPSTLGHLLKKEEHNNWPLPAEFAPAVQTSGLVPTN